MNRFLFALFVILGLATFAGPAATGQTIPPGPFLSIVGGCPRNQYLGGVLGEVINRSFTQAYSVTLEAQWLIEGKDIITSTFKPAFPATLPDQPNPFCFVYTYDEDPPHISIQGVSVIGATDYAPVTVVPQRIRCTVAYLGVIEGILRNDNAFPVSEIHFSLWDELRYTEGFQSALLPPGAEQSFTTGMAPLCHWVWGTPTETLDSFRTAAQGRRGFGGWLPLIRH